MKEKKLYGIIYRARNVMNDKVYIGQTTGKLKIRKSNHYTYARKNNNNKLYFYRAINKYGEDSFKWRTIDCAYSIEELNDKEKYWIKKYKSTNSKYGYNLEYGGFHGKPNAATRKRMSIAQKNRKDNFGWTDKRREDVSNKLKGRKLSEETKKKLSDSHRGIKMTDENKEKLRKRMLGKQYSLGIHPPQETRLKMSMSQKGIPKPKPSDFGDKISKARKGFRYTEEQKIMLSKAHKDKMTDEIRKHLSEGQKRRHDKK